MRGLIAEGVADGSVQAKDVRETAFALAGALNWISHWFQPSGVLSAATVAQRMLDILTLGLKPRCSGT